MKTILNNDGLVEYYSDFLSQSDAEYYFNTLAEEIAWQHDQLLMFGKHITTKRKVAWYANEPYEYIYSNTKKTARTWTTSLKRIKEQVELSMGESFNACLLNYYHNGDEGMGWHSDNEPMMLKHASIASISLGAQRSFMFRHKRKDTQHSIELENGSLLIMKDETQDHWKHQLPVRKRIHSARINLTFRHFSQA